MNKIRIELKWGLIFVLMQIVWMSLEKFLGFHDERIDQHAIVTNLIAIPSFAIYYFALYDKRKNYFGGYMNFMQGFISGLIITTLVTVCSPFVQILISELISPNYFANMISYSVEQGLMAQEAAEAYFNLESYLMQVVVGTPIMGLVTSLIFAVILKRKKKANPNVEVLSNE